MSLEAHLASGLTTTCRCWAVSRADGETFGFTDHDLNLSFEDIDFKAETGLTARALVSGTGLSVDNSEAMGALMDAAITEADIEAGRYDNAEVRMWLVNWADVGQRALRFRGHIGELRRQGGAFHAELRGLTEGLNQPQGRAYQRVCGAVLGDARCRVNLGDPALSDERPVEEVQEARVFRFTGFNTHAPTWFERGRLRVLDGAGAGQTAFIKRDRFLVDGRREVELWQSLRGGIAVGDTVRLEAGCDKRDETCRGKFSNFINFQGFPDIPGEDWLMRVPQSGDTNSGGSLR